MTTDIKKILDEIDGLRSRSEEEGMLSEAEGRYLFSLQKHYPTLRDYIARLERESEAGRRLADSLRGLLSDTPSEGESSLPNYYDTTFPPYLSLYRTACEGEDTK